MEYVTVKVRVIVWLDEKSYHDKLVVVKKFWGMTLEDAQKLKQMNLEHNHETKLYIQHTVVTDL